MQARHLVERIPVVRRETSALEAARIVATLRTNGVVVADADGHPVALVDGTQVLRLVVPRYVREDPLLAHVYDEAGADEIGARLLGRTVGDLLDDDDVAVQPLAQVLPDDTLIEIAAVLVRERAPMVVVRDEAGTSSGVVTLARVLAAVLALAGQADPGVQRTLAQDLLDLDTEGQGPAR